MEKYKQAQTQGKEFLDLRRRKPPPLPMEEDGRRTTHTTTNKKMRMEREKECVNNNNGATNESGNSNSTTGSSSFQGSGSRRSRSPRPGFDPATSTPSGQKPQSPLFFSRGSVGTGRAAAVSKVNNWRLACFMAREYLSRGTLLGKPWPPESSNSVKSKTLSGTAEQEETDESRRDKERLYSILTGNFLRSDDIHIPGIVNPTQLASWMGFK